MLKTIPTLKGNLGLWEVKDHGVGGCVQRVIGGTLDGGGCVQRVLGGTLR